MIHLMTETSTGCNNWLTAKPLGRGELYEFQIHPQCRPFTCPLIPDPSMVKTVRVQKDRFAFYDPEDDWWAAAVGLVEVKTVPCRHVLFVAGYDGNREPVRAAFAHPDTIEVINRTHRIMPDLEPLEL